MKNQQLLERITLNPKVMVGKLVIKGTRLTVKYILNLLAHGATVSRNMQSSLSVRKKHAGWTTMTLSRVG